MHAPFPGFGSEALGWSEGLRKGKSNEIFDGSREHRGSGMPGPPERHLKEPGGRVKAFRQDRDARFSKEEASCKANTYGGVKVPGCESGRHLSIAVEGLSAGSGYWRMAKDQLQRCRGAFQEMEGEAFESAQSDMEMSGVRLWGDALKTVPRFVPKDHPRIRLLRRKDMLIGEDLEPEATLAGCAPVAFARSLWNRSRRVMDRMDAHFGASTIPSEVRFGSRA